VKQKAILENNFSDIQKSAPDAIINKIPYWYPVISLQNSCEKGNSSRAYLVRRA